MRSVVRRLIGLAAIMPLVLLSACNVELYSGLSEKEANQVVAALIDAGIDAEKEASRDGVAVFINKDDFAKAVNTLVDRGLPTRKYATIGDVFQKSGIVSSPVEERARLRHAMNQELQATITEIDGVLSASVHVVIPEADILGRQLRPSSASVFVRHIKGVPIESLTPHIKLLVARSIEGLTYENVSVVMVPAVDVSHMAGAVVAAMGGNDAEPSINYVTLISRFLLSLLLVFSFFYYFPGFGLRLLARLRRT